MIMIVFFLFWVRRLHCNWQWLFPCAVHTCFCLKKKNNKKPSCFFVHSRSWNTKKTLQRVSFHDSTVCVCVCVFVFVVFFVSVCWLRFVFGFSFCACVCASVTYFFFLVFLFNFILKSVFFLFCVLRACSSVQTCCNRVWIRKKKNEKKQYKIYNARPSWWPFILPPSFF